MAVVEEATKLTYSEVLNIIYENLGQDAFYKANTTVGSEFLSLCKQAGIDVTVSPSGNILGYSKHVVGSKPLSSSEEIAQALNSNLQSGTAAVENTGAFDEIVNTTVEAGKVKPVSTVTKFTNGVKGVLNTPVAGKITPAIMAAAAGIQLGKIIDSSIYNIGKVMGANPPEELNPETWNNITADMSDKGLEGFDKWAFNTIFGLNPETGEATMYADENAFAYMAMYLNSLGVAGESEKYVTEVPKTDFNDKYIKPLLPVYTSGSIVSYRGVLSGNSGVWNMQALGGTHTATFSYVNGRDIETGIFTCSKTPFTGEYSIDFNGNNIETKTNVYHINASHDETVFNGDDFYVLGGSRIEDKKTFQLLTPTYNNKRPNNGNNSYIAYALLYGNLVESNPDGISDQNNAKFPDMSTWNTPDDVLKSLKDTYPELWNNAVQQDVMQPDGSVKTYTYVPLPMPTEGERSQVGTTGAVQNKSTVTPDNSTESQLATLIKILTNSQNQPQGQTKELTKDYPINPTKTPNPPDIGGGDSPAVIPVTGSASSLYAIYNPTLAEINSFGAWLWSDSFIDQIKKLFNDPMQAIIGLHKVYATPITGGAQNIKVGYLDSGVSSKIVTNQYTTIDCGTISCAEYFGNVFDYAPYTEVSLYLPFIGIVGLDVADVMRASIHVVYHVDVLSGACLAEVKVTRDSAGGTLYQYAGNAAVTLPISSGSYMGIVASVASIAGGIAGTIASGGAAAPMLINAAGSALNARTRVEHSGGFSGNAGAMGGKIPYLIISRPQTEIAENYQIYIGNPSNHTTTLSSCSGYVQVKECHLEHIPATQNELNHIESLLKGGVII